MYKKTTTLQTPSGLISSSNSNLTTSSYSSINYAFSGNHKKLHILGEDINFDTYITDIVITNISILNILGKPFLDELHKNGKYFPDEIEEYLKKRFKEIERDNKIDDIIN